MLTRLRKKATNLDYIPSSHRLDIFYEPLTLRVNVTQCCKRETKGLDDFVALILLVLLRKFPSMDTVNQLCQFYCMLNTPAKFHVETVCFSRCHSVVKVKYHSKIMLQV